MTSTQLTWASVLLLLFTAITVAHAFTFKLIYARCDSMNYRIGSTVDEFKSKDYTAGVLFVTFENGTTARAGAYQYGNVSQVFQYTNEIEFYYQGYSLPPQPNGYPNAQFTYGFYRGNPNATNSVGGIQTYVQDNDQQTFNVFVNCTGSSASSNTTTTGSIVGPTRTGQASHVSTSTAAVAGGAAGGVAVLVAALAAVLWLCRRRGRGTAGNSASRAGSASAYEEDDAESQNKGVEGMSPAPSAIVAALDKNPRQSHSSVINTKKIEGVLTVPSATRAIAVFPSSKGTSIVSPQRPPTTSNPRSSVTSSSTAAPPAAAATVNPLMINVHNMSALNSAAAALDTPGERVTEL